MNAQAQQVATEFSRRVEEFQSGPKGNDIVNFIKAIKEWLESLDLSGFGNDGIKDLVIWVYETLYPMLLNLAPGKLKLVVQVINAFVTKILENWKDASPAE